MRYNVCASDTLFSAGVASLSCSDATLGDLATTVLTSRPLAGEILWERAPIVASTSRALYCSLCDAANLVNNIFKIFSTDSVQSSLVQTNAPDPNCKR